VASHEAVWSTDTSVAMIAMRAFFPGLFGSAWVRVCWAWLLSSPLSLLQNTCVMAGGGRAETNQFVQVCGPLCRSSIMCV
jgi:hypothetical protein